MIPHYELRTKFEGDKAYLWDQIRKKWYVWQPEEAVRQQLIHYLIKEKGISPPLLAVEKEIKFHNLKRRFDIVVFDRMGKPFNLVECKAPEVELTSASLQQAAIYNSVLEAPHLLLFNGRQWAFFSKDNFGNFTFVKEGWHE